MKEGSLISSELTFYLPRNLHLCPQIVMLNNGVQNLVKKQIVILQVKQADIN